MVQADVIVGEISCQQEFLLATFSEKKIKFSSHLWLVITQHLS